jgi:hypothetical protein
MARRLQKTLVDYLVIAISPALIITLVGSLVFFLLEVFYHGTFQLRLHYVFALFIIGAVLISRISIEEGRERALLFALPLAIVTMLAINKFVRFQGNMSTSFSFIINLGLIGLVWWSADKLTWDCTLIDEDEEDSGEGLLEAVGLDRPGKAALEKEIAPPAASGEPEVTTSRHRKPTSWWERFIERRRRPHAPGVWIVYYSLAALPLFGIGQMFLPVGSLIARQYAFCLLCIYTASGLGLLLTTSFLGLRRYLRQRRQEMPLAMVNLWLIIGGLLIVGVMLAAMLLPRPNAEYAVSELPFRFGSPEQKSSPYGNGREGVNEKRPEARGEQREGEPPKSASPNPSDNKTSQPLGKELSPKGQTQAERKDEDSRNSASRDPSRGKQPENTAGNKSPGTDESRAGRDKAANAKQPEQKQDSGPQSPGKSTADKSPAENASPPQPINNRGPDGVPRMPPMLHPVLPAVSPLLLACKWLLYGALALMAIFSLWSSRDKLLAALGNFGQWLADFWHNLLPAAASDASPDEEQAGPGRAALRRFADFRDPFAAGIAGRYRPEELVRYTFEALEAWAQDHGYPREPEQTPHEFARRLAAQVSLLGDDAGQLADLYCQVAYAPGTLPAAPVARLSHLWQRLRSAADGGA